MIGETLGNRYRLEEKLGSGGMAEVYGAEDQLLNRPVTIKILREQFTHDLEFVRRFQQEARSVARLSHPNIVGIYDVGLDKDQYYLVMEYVPGITLRDLIKREGRLLPARAVRLALQIAAGLEHAHENGIIHRDIKPQNLLISERGQVKVTDFGISQVTAGGGTLSYTRSVLGTAHYISPEQARGEATGVQSDIYSLGVVLYEMLSGQVPFSGDNPISVALKHLEEEPTPLRGLVSKIPPVLENVVRRAMAKNPARRFKTIAEFKAELLRIAAELGFADQEGKPQKGGDRDLVSLEKTARSRKPRLILWLLLVVVLALLGYGVFLAASTYLIVAETEVPDVTGRSLAEAERILAGRQLRLEVGRKLNDPQVPEGRVVTQDPQARTNVRQGRTVIVDVSLGPILVEVPNVRQQPRRVAEINLEEAGFIADPQSEEVYSSSIPAGLVVEQFPGAHELHPKGTRVQLKVSLGSQPQMVTMPTLLGLSMADAKEAVDRVGLILGLITEQESGEYYPGQVAGQEPAPGDPVLQGKTVNLTISRGPGPAPGMAQVTIPLPDDGQRHVVSIVVEDIKGKREVYNENRDGGSIVTHGIEYYGVGRILIFIDGQMVWEERVPS